MSDTTIATVNGSVETTKVSAAPYLSARSLKAALQIAKASLVRPSAEVRAEFAAVAAAIGDATVKGQVDRTYAREVFDTIKKEAAGVKSKPAFLLRK